MKKSAMLLAVSALSFANLAYAGDFNVQCPQSNHSDMIIRSRMI